MNTVIPLISSVVALVFAIAVLNQFFSRRKPHQLLWSIGLFMYFISTGAEFAIGVWGLNQTVYRIWYLFGAILVVVYLGMGTIYLLIRRQIAHIILAIVLAVSAYAAFRVFTASIDLSALDFLSGRAIPPEIRAMTPAFNTFGTIALVGGAIYSALVFWRRRVMPHRVVSNTLIAVGAILPALGGTSLRLGGSLHSFYLLELVGIIVIFIGFLRSREVFGLQRLSIIQKASVETSTKQSGQ